MDRTLNICEKFYKTKNISYDDFLYLMKLEDLYKRSYRDKYILQK